MGAKEKYTQSVKEMKTSLELKGHYSLNSLREIEKDRLQIMGYAGTYDEQIMELKRVCGIPDSNMPYVWLIQCRGIVKRMHEYYAARSL